MVIHRMDKIVFTDEKKFNLDGPDGFQYNWYDLRREPEMYSKRVRAEGSLWYGGVFRIRERLI